MRSFLVLAVSAFQTASFERYEPVRHEPRERNGTVIHDPCWGAGLAQLRCDFMFQNLVSLGLGHARL